MNRSVVLTAVIVGASVALAVLLVSLVDSGPPAPTEPATERTDPKGRPSLSAAPLPRAVPSPSPSRRPDAARDDGSAGEASVETVGAAEPLPSDPDAERDQAEPPHEVSVWPLDKDGIQGAVREAAPAMNACYNEALARDPSLAGHMTLGFTVTDQNGVGEVTMVEIDDGGVTDDGMFDCILDAFEGLQFDPPQGDGELSVTHPVIFSTGVPEQD